MAPRGSTSFQSGDRLRAVRQVRRVPIRRGSPPIYFGGPPYYPAISDRYPVVGAPGRIYVQSAIAGTRPPARSSLACFCAITASPHCPTCRRISGRRFPTVILHPRRTGHRSARRRRCRICARAYRRSSSSTGPHLPYLDPRPMTRRFSSSSPRQTIRCRKHPFPRATLSPATRTR
jgi:hypothetical protein